MIKPDYKHDNKYIYNNGFKHYYYTCQNCGSHKVQQVPTGGFSPPDLHCEDCNEKNVTNSPHTLTEEEMVEAGIPIKKEKKSYKVWITIEEITETDDDETCVDLDVTESAGQFDTQESAIDRMHEISKIFQGDFRKGEQ